MSTGEIVYVQRAVPSWEVLCIQQPMTNSGKSLQAYSIQKPGNRSYEWGVERDRHRIDQRKRTVFQYANSFKNA
jgi:hypothetical protein